MDWLKEAITISIAAIAGAWAIFMRVTRMHNELESRLDAVERDYISRREFQEFAREMRENTKEIQHHIDRKFDSWVYNGHCPLKRPDQ